MMRFVGNVLIATPVTVAINLHGISFWITTIAAVSLLAGLDMREKYRDE
jgi:general stress protein CsbA